MKPDLASSQLSLTRRLAHIDEFIGALLARHIHLMLLLVLIVASLVCATYQALALTHRYALDYGEAPLVDQALRLAAGQNIYRTDLSKPPYGVSNYPPLYSIAMLPLIQLFGPSFWAGRAIAALCAWMSAWCLGRIIHTQMHDRVAGIATGLFFLSFPYVVKWSGYARIDLLALAFSLSGLLAVARQPLSRRRLIVGGVLLVAAIYTRQSYALAAPLAAGVWLLAHNRRQAIGLAILVGGLALGVFLVLNRLTQGGFYFNIVTANVNEFGLDRLQWNLYRFWNAAAIPVCLGGASLLLIRRWNPLWPLAAPYLIGAALSALTIGKIGSNVNYFLELCAALSLAAGVVLAWSRRTLSVHTGRIGIVLLLALAVGPLIQTTFKEVTPDLYQRRAATHELAQLEKIVADTPGPVLADEYMGLLTLQGRLLTIQPFEVTQLARVGLWDQTPVVDGIQKKEYPLILIHYFKSFPVYKERWTPEMLAAVGRSYVATDNLADTRVYRPIETVAPVSTQACPGASWRLPVSGVLDVQRDELGLNFYGQGNEGAVPVYAVADGRLTRWPDWLDAVAIQHDDARQPGNKVWSYYSNMMNGNGTDSYVAPEFPQGTVSMPVRAGQLLGYQGRWSGRPNWPGWMRVHLAVIKATDQETFPSPLTPDSILDPLPYLGLSPHSRGTAQSLSCGK